MPTEIELPSPESPLCSAYDRFARVYDDWMAGDFCRRVMPILEKLLLSQLPARSSLLDLCCGTGRIAATLASRGYDVTGVDSSDWMLRLARENAPAARFTMADARDFELDARFDGALCAFNSLAHMHTTHELAQVFSCLRRALHPGAPFLFDLSMREAYITKWRGALAHVTDDCVCVIRPHFDALSQTGTNRITLMELAAGEWRRSDLAITQRCHSEHELRSILQRCGFTDVRVYDAERALDIAGEFGRSFFLCHSERPASAPR